MSICKYKYDGANDTECLPYDTLTMAYGAQKNKDPASHSDNRNNEQPHVHM